ncbi:MAG: hypothetical protein QM820_36235 [Minicystis sp.]
MPVVLHLSPGIDLLAGLAITGAEMTMVEDDHAKPGLRKDLREGVEVHLFHRRKPMRHDDGGHRSRRAVWQVEPTP